MVTRSSIPKSDVPGVPIPWRSSSVVLDGKTEYTTSTPISDAVSDANVGSVITIGPGTFEENVAVDKRLTVIGSGRASLIDGGATGHGLEVRAEQCVIQSLAAQTTRGQGNNYDAVHVADGFTANHLSNVIAVDSDRYGVFLDSGNNLAVGTTVFDAEQDGIRVQGGGNELNGLLVSPTTSMQNGINLEISRNVVVGATVRGNSVMATGLQVNAQGNTVMGMVARTTTTRGVDIPGDDVALIGALIDNSETDAIRISGEDCQVGIVRTTNTTGTALDDGSATNPRYSNVIADGTIQDNIESPQTDADYIARLVDSPNASISNTVLDDGDSAEKSVPVADGETLKVYRWGAYQISDGTTPNNLDVELLDGSDTVQATENTGDNESTDPSTPVASHTNSSGSVSIFKLAVANDTGSTIADPGVGAFFAYVVE